jgi:hypothetical protein
MRPARDSFLQMFPDIGPQIDKIIDKLEGELGESPEARRGAFEMVRMLAASVEVIIESAPDKTFRDKLIFMLGAPLIFYKERYEELANG